MNRDSYEKKLLRQKIQAHREVTRLEWKSLRGNNPVTSALGLGASVTSLVGGRNGLLLKAATVAIPALVVGVMKWRRRRKAARSAAGKR